MVVWLLPLPHRSLGAEQRCCQGVAYK
uniref:Uncharacterized protein n=1 Tax=Arundo donax TaxID=35708 RepID=A0A0A9A609_ARUDO